MRIVMLGAPGSGKGTQAQRLQQEQQLPQVSTGDLLRRELELGRLSGRGYHRVRRVARTLADLAGRAADARVKAPALVVVGEVVRVRERLAWFVPGAREAARQPLTQVNRPSAARG